jgi:hypothetical protein
MIGFIEKLRIVTKSNYIVIANPHCLQFTTALHLSLLCLHKSLHGDGYQHYPLFPYSHSYRMETVPQLNHSESELLYDGRFAASQFLLAPIPLKLRTGVFSCNGNLAIIVLM